MPKMTQCTNRGRWLEGVVKVAWPEVTHVSGQVGWAGPARASWTRSTIHATKRSPASGSSSRCETEPVKTFGLAAQRPGTATTQSGGCLRSTSGRGFSKSWSAPRGEASRHGGGESRHDDSPSQPFQQVLALVDTRRGLVEVPVRSATPLPYLAACFVTDWRRMDLNLRYLQYSHTAITVCGSLTERSAIHLTKPLRISFQEIPPNT